jgi:hypothetical protein
LFYPGGKSFSERNTAIQANLETANQRIIADNALLVQLNVIKSDGTGAKVLAALDALDKYSARQASSQASWVNATINWFGDEAAHNKAKSAAANAQDALIVQNNGMASAILTALDKRYQKIMGNAIYDIGAP